MKNLIIAAFLLLLCACSSTKQLPIISDPKTELPKIKQLFKKELSTVQVGDYIKEIKEKFPSLYLASDSMKNTVYEFSHKQAYLPKTNLDNDKVSLRQSSISPIEYEQKIAFYFINKKLVHWQVK
ncbi:hypothetical protein [Litorilituus lipolyticus]|uniref:Outer membrane protein assembly factor BamE n=1 Tax=Litorilituus lipolyticus TaxID=2491017 RepID=A0A502L4Q2_9GAMM|nr:hypothetical protein [Litorilituus lipolyticus]TPH18164.1 hypothetical protein EPA86_03370 [Litorilituus lipolyticus]